MTKIKKIKVKEILDSRGNPTVEIELETNKGKFSASVPSGASKGKYEALELRDEDGKGVKKAISNIKKIISPAIKNKEFSSQKEVDETLIELDGTENKSHLGVNAILPVSIAVCRALAADQKIPLYKYIAQLVENGSPKILGELFSQKLPRPCFNIIEGGAHVHPHTKRDDAIGGNTKEDSSRSGVGARNNLDLQEFMIIPQKRTFRENFKVASDIYQILKDDLIKNFGQDTIKIGDEGGFAPPLSETERALYVLVGSIKNHPDTKIGLDAAASQFYKEDKYCLEGNNLTRTGLLDFYKNLIAKFPIIFIEDPFSEEDWPGFQEARIELKIDIFGDDLLVTNIKRIKEAENKKACNGLILKPNQIGTVTETIEAAKLAKSYGWKILVAHRSGETNDDFIADLAVGVGADFIKSGAPVTPERMVKYNRLLEIENEIVLQQRSGT